MVPSAATICGAARVGRKLPGGGPSSRSGGRGSTPVMASRLKNSRRRAALSDRRRPRISLPSGPMMKKSRSGTEFLWASSQIFREARPPFARTSEAGIATDATDGRRCTSGDSYSRAATVKVMAMLPPTISAIATQNSMKIRRNRLCMGPCQGIARSAHILDLRVFPRLEIELAAQIADVRIDAAIVRYELAAERLLGHRLPRDHLPRRAHEQFEHAKLRSGQRHRLVRDAHLMHPCVEDDRSHGQFVGNGAAGQTAAGAA